MTLPENAPTPLQGPGEGKHAVRCLVVAIAEGPTNLNGGESSWWSVHLWFSLDLQDWLING